MTDIAAPRIIIIGSQFISRLTVSLFLSCRLLYISDLVAVPTGCLRNAISTSAFGHHWYCHTSLSFGISILTDGHADWSNIGFKIREGV